MAAARVAMRAAPASRRARLPSLGSAASEYSGGGALSAVVAARRRHCGGRAAAAVEVRASLLGVGAPEAVMIGVVALVVFGPKGLAEAAKSLGKAVRSLQPTIQELASVSNDLKSTIEDEIGLDEIRRDFQGISTPEPKPRKAPLPGEEAGDAAAKSLSSMSDSMAEDPDIEKKRAEAAAAAWGGQAPAEDASAPAAAPSVEAATTSAPEASKSVADMSIDELQAEIARRQVPKKLSAED